VIYVIDNYDSFTYNLVQYLGQLGGEPFVRRNDETSLVEIAASRPRAILLSPGPCTPRESGVCLDVIRAALDPSGPLAGIPVFGVCLGHQAIAHSAGATVDRARRVRHGKTSPIRHDGQGLFAGVPNPFRAVRYHSLAIDEDTLPPDFVITARAEDDGEIMGIRHRSLPIEGIQFHPESAFTEHGLTLVANMLAR
jgi:anthranilate synthase/aminodeoxychorismate synthase-like glutamine amidotransferase